MRVGPWRPSENNDLLIFTSRDVGAVGEEVVFTCARNFDETAYALLQEKGWGAMALVKCKECGEQVSTSAMACPKCGAKPPKKISLITWSVLGVILLAVIVGSNGEPSGTAPSEEKPVASSEALQPPPAPEKKPQWETSTSVDKMTGKVQAYATSLTVPSTEKMEFPYANVAAWMGVGCDGESEWAYVGFSDAPNLTNTETESGYNRIRTRMKWGDTLQDVSFTQEWGAPVLHFENDRQAVESLTRSSSALLELKWYGQVSAYFSFPLEGSSAAISDMRNQCSEMRKSKSAN